jgi:hypothetical protein
MDGAPRLTTPPRTYFKAWPSHRPWIVGQRLHPHPHAAPAEPHIYQPAVLHGIEPGVELAGPLPPEIQFDTNFGGAVSATSKSADAARDLLIFLKKPTAIGVIKAQGMEPI